MNQTDRSSLDDRRYECSNCGHREAGPLTTHECANCGGEMRDISLPRE